MRVSGVVNEVMSAVTENDSLMRALIPVVRGYIRYVPIAAGKKSFWNTVVNPYFAWQSYEFEASTIFGSRVHGNTRELLQQYLYYFGVWEPHLTRWIRRRLASGDTFVDVGANVGHFTLLASKLVGDSGRVVAIEASGQTFEALVQNLSRNKVRNVRAIHAAASDLPGVVKVFRGPETHIGLSTIIEAEARKQGCELEGQVAAAPLLSLLNPEEIRTARLIKIDAEGAEWAVVAGMSSMLHSGRPDLEVTVEINPACLARQGRSADELVQIFSAAGFHPYLLENNYKAAGYIPPIEVRRPVRLRRPIEWTMDVVFSREDADAL